MLYANNRSSLYFFFILINLYYTSASNWAQTTGPRRQNAAIPSKTGWQPRWGHTIMAVEEPLTPPPGGWAEGVDPDDVVSTANQIYVLGGDDFDEKVLKGGYHNDVWRSTGAEWEAISNKVLGEPKQVSMMKWKLVWGDKLPPIGVTYDEWLDCFARKWRGVPQCVPKDDPYSGDLRRWSPRRNHVAVYFKPISINNNFQKTQRGIWVLGGRARAIDDIPVKESWGGIIPWGDDGTMKAKFNAPPRAYRDDQGNRQNPFDPNDPGGVAGSRYIRNFWREKTVLKNDVWSSEDGVAWYLINAGCKFHEEGHEDAQKLAAPGVEHALCLTDSDCYGDSICINRDGAAVDVLAGEAGKCQCRMWSPRERHAAVVFNNKVYISGGFTHVQSGVCGQYNCGSSYRSWSDEVWSSIDGEEWQRVTPLHGKRWRPRGEHGMVVMHNRLYIMGGRGGDTRDASHNPLFNDVWYSDDRGETWNQTGDASWSPRSNMVTVVLNKPSPSRVLVFGGETEHAVVQDTWWSYLEGAQPEWFRDFANNTDELQARYIDPDGPLDLISSLSHEEVAILRDFEITTIRDLALQTSEVIDKVRARLPDVCRHKKKAEGLVRKCTVLPYLFDGYQSLPNVVTLANDIPNPYIAFRQPEEVQVAVHVVLHGVVESDYGDDGCVQSEEADLMLPELEDAAEWHEAALRGWDPEAVCRWVPSNRTEHSGVVFRNKFYVFGGRQAKGIEFPIRGSEEISSQPGALGPSNTVERGTGYSPGELVHDCWYRDDTIPQATISQRPEDDTHDNLFRFACDESACLFEFILYEASCQDEGCVGPDFTEPSEGNEWHDPLVINWTPVISSFDFYDVIGGGRYSLRVRAIDPAGNFRNTFVEGVNQYSWTYNPKLPSGLITGSIFAFIVVWLSIIMEVRRRRKKRAMERYALKRMRRKFKGMQKDASKKKTKKKKKKKDRKKSTVDKKTRRKKSRKTQINKNGTIKKNKK